MKLKFPSVLILLSGLLVSSESYAQVEMKNLIQSKELSSAFRTILNRAPSTQTRILAEGEVMIDPPVVPFSKSREYQNYLRMNGPPAIVDQNGYPAAQTIYQDPAFQKQFKKRSNSRLKNALNFLFPDESHANYDISPGAMPGEVNCRANSAVSGHFKAFFEDIALDTNAGYDHPSLGPNRVAAICQVLQDFSILLKLDQQIGVTPEFVFPANLPPSFSPNALASAGSYYSVASLSNADNGYLNRHIITHVDPSPGIGNFDAFVYTNFSMPWSVDLPGSPTAYDFETVMKHEVLHALGFTNVLPFGLSATNVPILHNTFNENTYADQASATVASNRYFVFPSTAMLSPLIQVPVGNPSSYFVNNTSVYQGKKNFATAPFDGVRPVYSPLTITPGSSLGHFDEARAVAGTSYLMHPSLSAGQVKGLHNDELEVLCHLGYQVTGMCDDPTPVAVDDFGIVTGPGQCISHLGNDQAFSCNNGLPCGSGNLMGHSIQWISQPVGGVSYYSDSNCTTPITSWIQYAKSISINNNASQQPIVFKYSVKDTVTNRISAPATVSYSNCNSPANEYICNGDFELGASPGTPLTSPYGNGEFYPSLGRAPFWGSADITPDLVRKNSSIGSNNAWSFPWLSTPTDAYGNPTAIPTLIDMVDNGNYAAVMFSWTGGSEKVSTKFKQPLTPGETYQLSFDALLLGIAPFNFLSNMNSAPVTAGLSVSCMFQGSPGFCAAPVSFNTATTILSQVLPAVKNVSNATWTHLSQTFVATQPFEHLVISFPNHSDGLPLYVDNVSIIKVTNSNTISGVVYNDLNANGLRDGELGIANITVGLFDGPTATTPLMTVQSSSIPGSEGNYSFSVLGGVSNYYVAIVPENSVVQITEPALNSNLNGYQYAWQVPFAPGNVTNKNFGIRLSGQPVIIPPKISYVTSRGCGENQGSINLTVSSGTPPYSFSWNNGQYSTEDLTGIPSGTYVVTVTDAAGITATSTIVLPAPAPLTLTGMVQPTAGGANIDITVTGPGPYTYQWSNGATTEDLFGVPPGTYTVTVMNEFGCRQVQTFVVHAPISIISTVNPGCTQNNGAIFLLISGGVGPYQISWTGPNGFTSTTQNIYSLTTGTYTVTVYGASGTVGTATVVVPAPVPLTVSGLITYSGNLGNINVTSNGTQPYTYVWSHGSTSEDQVGLSPGNYTVNVWDANKCNASKVFSIKKQFPKLTPKKIYR